MFQWILMSHTCLILSTDNDLPHGPHEIVEIDSVGQLGIKNESIKWSQPINLITIEFFCRRHHLVIGCSSKFDIYYKY